MSVASTVQKQSLADVVQNRYQACNFVKKRLQHRCFSMKFAKSLRTPFWQNTSTLMAACGSKQWKLMKTYTESLTCRKKKWYTGTVLLRLVFLINEYSSEVFQTVLAVPHPNSLENTCTRVSFNKVADLMPYAWSTFRLLIRCII